MASASLSAVRSISRSASTRISLLVKPKSYPFLICSSSTISLSNCRLRCAVPTGFWLESKMPHHTAIASALMVSLLSVPHDLLLLTGGMFDDS